MISINSKVIQKYLTPYKYGHPVLMGSGVKGAFDEKSVDIPFVFFHNNKFYMLYTGYDGIGYQSALATSTDLLNWEKKGVVLDRTSQERWDKVGAAATWIIKEENELTSLPKLKKIQGKYWMVYHSYPLEGYEAGPAEIGLAWTEDEELMRWNRLDQPIFSWKDGEEWEKGGLYKACIIFNQDTWYMFYNAKNKEKRWIEQTGVAISKDLIHWERSTQNPILRTNEEGWDERFVSDPYIVRDEDKWLNFYFGYGNGHAQEGLAISKDLITWEKIKEPIITSGEVGEIDERHAHKASILYYQDVLYHFYCAAREYRKTDKTKVYDEFRTITVAASRRFEK